MTYALYVLLYESGAFQVFFYSSGRRPNHPEDMTLEAYTCRNFEDMKTAQREIIGAITRVMAESPTKTTREVAKEQILLLKQKHQSATATQVVPQG